MIVEASVTIQGSREAVWAVASDIENAADILSGVVAIEMVEKPAKGLVGLRWRETRMLFGEATTVEKWITEAVESETYETRAEDGGFVFLTRLRIAAGSGGIVVTSGHETRPQGFVARIKGLPMFLFKGVIRKAILRDLNDIKTAVESK